MDAPNRGLSIREVASRISIYPFLMPLILLFLVKKDARILDLFYEIRSYLTGFHLRSKLRLTVYDGIKIIYPTREDPNLDDVFLRNVYYPYKPKADDVVIDVGAHMGFFTLKQSPKVKAVFSVEPDPYSFSFLKRNVRNNGAENVHVFNLALSDKNGTMFLKTAYGHGRSSLSEGTGGVPVNVKTLDKLLSDLDVRPTLIKIDTEGYEMPILRGALGTISESGPAMLIASYHYPGEVDEVREFLREHGYVGYIYSVPLAMQAKCEQYIYAEKVANLSA